MNLLIRMAILYLCIGACMMLVFPEEVMVIKGNPFTNTTMIAVNGENVTIAEGLNKTIPSAPEQAGAWTSLWEKGIGGLAVVWSLIALLINLAIFPLNLAMQMGLPYPIRLFFGIFGVTFYLAIIFFIRGIST